MVADDEAVSGLAEKTVFLYYFMDLPDHRRSGKVSGPLDETLFLCWLAAPVGAEAFVDISRFREK
jgi:hypothetical protein